MKLYAIRKWDSIYENNRTRDLKKLDWFPMPNKQDGDGYTLIMQEKDGAAIFGAWVACVQIASRCDPRGTLMRDSQTPHTAHSLARMSRISAGISQRMLDVCSSHEINWLTSTDYVSKCENPAGGCENPAGGCLEGKEGKEGIEGKEGASLSILIKEVFDEWNGMAEGTKIPTVLQVSDKRRRTLEVRLKEEFFKTNWREALRKIPSVPFLRGENDRGWKADFDWFISPDAMAKVIEGKYDSAGPDRNSEPAKKTFNIADCY